MGIAAIILGVFALALIYVVLKKIINAIWFFLMTLLGLAIAIFSLVATISGFLPAILGIVFGLALAGTSFGSMRSGSSGRSSSHSSSSSSYSSGSRFNSAAVESAVSCFDVFAGLGGGTVYCDYAIAHEASREAEVYFKVRAIWGCTTTREVQELVDKAHEEVAERVQSEWPDVSVRTKCTEATDNL